MLTHIPNAFTLSSLHFLAAPLLLQVHVQRNGGIEITGEVKCSSDNRVKGIGVFDRPVRWGVKQGQRQTTAKVRKGTPIKVETAVHAKHPGPQQDILNQPRQLKQRGRALTDFCTLRSHISLAQSLGFLFPLVIVERIVIMRWHMREI